MLRITPFKVIQGHREFKPIETRKLIYTFLLVINTNLLPILHRFRDISFDSISLYLATPLVFNSSDGGVDLRKILPGCQQMAISVPSGVETLPNISIVLVGCTNVTHRRQTEGRRHKTGRKFVTQHFYNRSLFRFSRPAGGLPRQVDLENPCPTTVV